MDKALSKGNLRYLPYPLLNLLNRRVMSFICFRVVMLPHYLSISSLCTWSVVWVQFDLAFRSNYCFN